MRIEKTIRNRQVREERGGEGEGEGEDEGNRREGGESGTTENGKVIRRKSSWGVGWEEACELEGV